MLSVKKSQITHCPWFYKTNSTIYRNLIAGNLFPFIHNLESFIFQDICQSQERNQTSNYFEGGGHSCYSISDHNANWTEAIDVCQETDSHLLYAHQSTLLLVRRKKTISEAIKLNGLFVENRLLGWSFQQIFFYFFIQVLNQRWYQHTCRAST